MGGFRSEGEHGRESMVGEIIAPNFFYNFFSFVSRAPDTPLVFYRLGERPLYLSCELPQALLTQSSGTSFHGIISLVCLGCFFFSCS